MIRKTQLNLTRIALALLPFSAAASGPSQPDVSKVEVAYVDGSMISVRCPQDRCFVEVVLAGKKHTFKAEELLVEPIPSRATLYSQRALPGTFSFELQVDCKEYSDRPPFRACFGNFFVENGRITRRRRFSREIGRVLPGE